MDKNNEMELELPPKEESIEVKDEAEIKEKIEIIETENSTDTHGKHCGSVEVFNQNKEICDEIKQDIDKLVQKPKKKLRMEIDINLIEADGEFDAFSDNNSIYRKYNLRDKRKPVMSQMGVTKDVKVNLKTLAQLKILPKDEIEDDYVCPHCFMDCKSKFGITAHIKTHKRITTFTCSQCSAKFDSNTKLVIHKNEHAKDETSYTCKKCKLAFSDHCDYLKHEVIHKKGDKYRCIECQMVCTSKSGIRIHINTHFDKKVKCHICSKMIQGYTFPNHLKYHNEHVECEECGKICRDKHTLDYHMTTHTGVKLFQCLYCGKGFANNSQRMVHTRIHTGERPYQCTTCPEKFKQQTDLNRHMTTHDTVPKYKCEICDKKFFHKYYLDGVHMRRHTYMPYECKECGKRFPNAGGLKKHTLFKHTTKKNFKCKPCNLSFYLLAHYKRHCSSIRHKNIMFKETMIAKLNQSK